MIDSRSLKSLRCQIDCVLRDGNQTRYMSPDSHFSLKPTGLRESD